MAICTGYCLWNSMREREPPAEPPADGLSSIDHREIKYKMVKCTNQEQRFLFRFKSIIKSMYIAYIEMI